MSQSALALILERSKDEEKQAIQAVEIAQQELINYHQQLQQIEQYRLDYSQQLTSQGAGGVTAGSYSHLLKFLNQLDETLVKQKEAGAHFEHQVEQANLHWQEVRKQRRSIEWLLEKKQKEQQALRDKQEQNLMDEFATLQFARRQGRY